MNNTAASFLRLVNIMDELREKCPWDKKQTIHSLKPMTLEETYELTDAITKENWQHIKEELGDVLLHIIFYCKIAQEEKRFEIDEMINAICDKLVYRHPHIYGDAQVNNEDDVKRNWQKLKLKGKNDASVLSGIPNALPAIIKATRMQEKAKQVGFEWENKEDVWKKVDEELNELKAAVLADGISEVENEFGDVLFSLINYARFLKIDAETALDKTNNKFIYRFQLMEKIAAERGKQLADLTLGEMDAIWNEIKHKTYTH